MGRKSQETIETSRTIIVRVSPETHRALRVHVAERDVTIQAWVTELIERGLGVGPNASGAEKKN